MGNFSSMLTQYDIEEFRSRRSFLYTRDSVSWIEKAAVSSPPRSSCPCLSLLLILSLRLLRVVDGLNFKEFVAFLSAFSPCATLQQKIEFIFKVYDSDGNGKVTFNDMLDVFHDLTGQYISEKQRKQVLTQVLEEAGYIKESLLGLSDFVKAKGETKEGFEG
ncbi:Detected protein of confused Function [Hibiscus syriacus]|uniref:Detected protein of confused Function n=1 Tax=Hibiscus syriacus TaxID=106335 RepID=A0A6A3CAN2_HIBSY|nr:Detected protein of confused Function [Hibiscus syriacus]